MHSPGPRFSLPFGVDYCAVAGSPTLNAQQPASSVVELRPGVVIDPQRRVAYVMNPKGGVDALGLGRGELVWHGGQAARPLAASGAVVVAQAELPKPGNELQVRLLDARTGRLNRSIRHPLPAGTRTMVVGTAEGTFDVQALAHPIRCNARMGVRRCAVAGGQAWRSRPGSACWREAGNCRGGISADNDRRHSNRPSHGQGI